MFGSLQVSHPMYMAIFSASFQDSCDISGQTIATSHDLGPPNGGLVREIHLFQGNLGSMKYDNLARI